MNLVFYKEVPGYIIIIYFIFLIFTLFSMFVQIVTAVCPQASFIFSKRKIGAAKAERFRLMLLFSNFRLTSTVLQQEKLELLSSKTFCSFN